MANSNAASNAISLSSLLGIAFIVLKLVGVIGWPWLWVLAPFWIPFAAAAVFFVGVGLFTLVGVVRMVLFAFSRKV